jgi:hypothetical protein
MDLYYYTTAETMRFILTKGDIYATHISYLNDSEEYINGLRELRGLLTSGGKENNKYKEVSDNYLNEETYEDAVKNVPELYSISFSKESDLLSQWYMYSKESGIRLKLSMPDDNMLSFQVKKASSENEKQKITGSLQDVHYFTRLGMETNEYKIECEKIFNTIDSYVKEQNIENDIEGNIIRIWKDISPYIKNYEFRQEKEVRLIFQADVNKNTGNLIEYRNFKGVLIPYLDVYKQGGWPVVEIMVGPGRNQDRVFRSICHFIEHSKLLVPNVEQKENARLFLDGMEKYQIENNQINKYFESIQKTVQDQKIITYRDAIYDCLKKADKHVNEYLKRNFYSGCGIIVRKSNAPYEF